MTSDDIATLREQLINARADLRVKDEQLERQSIRHQEQLRVKDEQLRVKDEQLRVKDEQLNSAHTFLHLTQADLAIARGNLRVKDQQHHEQILGFVQLGNNFFDKLGGDVDRLKTTHTGIDRYVRHIPPLLTKQPSENKKHVIAILAHQEEDGKYETQTIAGQKEYVDRITKNVPVDEFLCEIEDDGNPIDTRNNLTRALKQELSRRTRNQSVRVLFFSECGVDLTFCLIEQEAPTTELGNCRSRGHRDELPVEFFAEMLDKLRQERQERQHDTLVTNKYVPPHTAIEHYMREFRDELTSINQTVVQ